MNKLNFFLLILTITCLSFITPKKELDIREDFSFEVDYRLEKTSSAWHKRGTIQFLQKKSHKNHKPGVVVQNENLNAEEIKSECENGNGLYYVRINNKNTGHLLFSSVKSCELIKNNFHDEFIINYFGPIKADTIISINYDSDNKYMLKDNYSNKEKSNYATSVNFVENVQSIGATFPEEKEAIKGAKAGDVPQEQSFFQKYWWMIMIVVVMVMTRGGGSEEAASGEAPAE